MLNKVTLIGNLGTAPEIRLLASGTTVTEMRLATTEYWTDQSGAKQNRTEWHRIVCYGKLAETCSKYLDKGRQVYVEGRIQTRSWEANGEKKYITEIIANEVKFLDSKNETERTQTENE